MRLLLLLLLHILLLALCARVALAQQLATRGEFSVATGSALTICTAGVAATFTISARDESSAARTSGGDIFFLTLDAPDSSSSSSSSSSAAFSYSIVDSLTGTYAASYTARQCCSALLTAALAQSGGLSGAYYENVWFFYTPAVQRVDPVLDFDWGSAALVPGAADFVSARWTGLLRPLYSEVYTLYADADDGVRLWINDAQLIDRWDGGANMTAAKLALTASRFYRIKVEYKESTGNARLSLYWSSPSTLKEIIPASQLFYEIPCKSFPTSLTIMPAASCATTSVATGSGLATSATAGAFASFSIESHDAFSNYRNVGGDLIVAHLFPFATTARASQSAITDNADGTYFASFKPFSSGSSSLFVQYLSLGGLQATMYTDTGFSQITSTVTVTSIDFTKTSAPYIGSSDPSNDSLFSIRYSGYFKATVTGTHTFQVDLAYQGENYVLYIDNLLVIDASSGSVTALRAASISLVSTNYYNLQLNYISSSASAGNRKVTLSVINPSAATFSPVPSSQLYQGFHVSGSPFPMFVSPARLCSSLCVVTDGVGDALSIATAGLAAIFTITAKDIFGNLRSSGNSSDTFRIALSGSSGVSGSAVSNIDGTYKVIYTITQSGTYDLSVVFGSALVGNSPYKIWAQPAGRVLRNSPARGSGLSLLTAGIQATVTITIRDGFSNWQPQNSVSSKLKFELQDGTNIAVTYCSASNCPSFASGIFVANPVTLDNPRYIVSFIVTKAGFYSFAIYGSDAFDTHIMGSPFKLTVMPSSFNDAIISDFQSTTSIAGLPSYFSSQTFDAYGNVCYDCTQVLSVYTRLSNFRDIVGFSTSISPSRYNSSFIATKCQSNSIYVVFGTSVGILATYFSTTSYTSPVSSIKVPDIDFSLAANYPYQGISSTFSARYSGLFRPSLSGIATFKLAHKSATDAYKLTISNIVVATMSSGNIAATKTYIFSRLVANQLYDIVFEYIASNVGDMHGIAFSVNMGWGDLMITSQNLFATRSASASPLSFTTSPGSVCASLLTRQSSGHSLSIATAGVVASFTIQSRDLFNNIRTVNSDDGITYALVLGGIVPPNIASSVSLNIQATALDGGRDAFIGSIDAISSGGYIVKYSATLSGLYQLSGRVQRPGGLYGLYFETDYLQDNSLTPSLAVASQPTFQRLDSQINFRWGAEKPMDTTDASFAPFSSKSIGPDFFSIRWYGSVLAPSSEIFTFSAEADDGVRLYVDNLLIINQWDFKSAIVDGTIALMSGILYSVKLEYKEAQNNATIVLMWSSRSLSRTIIPSSSLFYSVTSGPISSQVVYVPPSTACHTFSSIYGPGLTVATAGLAAYFTIQSLDSYGNHRHLMDTPYFVVKVSHMTSNTQLRPYKSQVTGLSSGNMLTSSIDRISNPRLNGGLTATYYSGSFLNGGVVSCQNLAWRPSNGCGGVDLASFVSGSNPFVFLGLGSMAGSTLMARWAGYFQPTSSGLYRFYLLKSALTSVGFSVSSTNGGTPPLVSFSGITAANPSASLVLLANSFYEIAVTFDQNGQSDLVCKLQYVFESAGGNTDYSSSSLVPTANLFPLAGRYRVMYTAPTIKGDFFTEVSLAIPGGIDATFYDDISFVNPRSNILHTAVDFTSTSFASNVMRVSSSGLSDVGYGLGVNVSDFNSFSVRWQGFFKATLVETTFSISVRETDERVRLWVDNLLLINSWDYALSGTSFSATFGALYVDQNGLRQSDFNSLFDVKLEYVQFAGNSGITAALFTASNLFTKRDIAVPPPFPVNPAITCAAKSRVQGSALTRATAGIPSSFTIMSLDMYQNDRDVDGDVYVSRLYPVVCEFASACAPIYGTVSSLGDSSYVVSYLGSKKGSYDLLTSLALPSLLTATYYGTSPFTGTSNTIFKAYSASVTIPSSSGGVRYAGFIQPPAIGPVTFSVSTASSCSISIWIFDTRLSVASSNIFSSATSGSSVINFPTANALYDVRVDLLSCSTSLSFTWSFSGFSAASIPSTRMFGRADVPNSAVGVSSGVFSPASLMLVARDTCSTQSLSKGVGLTVATAGASASFTLTARDAYANDRGLAEDSWVIRFSGPSRLTAAAFGDTRALSPAASLTAVSYSNIVGPGRYSVSYVLTVSGLYNLEILRASAGGLNADYFCNSWLSGTPCLTTIDQTIDFNWGLNSISPSKTVSITGSNFVSVRWSGYFLWETSEPVTFFTETDEGVRLYVDGYLVIDQWDAIGSNFSATWSGSGVGGLYSISLEYKESTDVAFCRLLYSTASVFQQPVPTSLLFPTAEHVFGSPFSTYIYAVSTCSATSTATLSPSFTLYTVGAFTSITVTTRDQYSNMRTDWDPVSPAIFIRACAVDFSDYCKRTSVTKSAAQGSWTASFTATRAAPTYILASLVHTASPTFLGMHATYYNSQVIGSAALKNAVFTISSSSLSSDTKAAVWGTSANPLPFSIRWTGIFVASARGQYTFSVGLAASDGALLYVNNINVINSWATAAGALSVSGTILLDAGVNAFYDIILDYRRSVNTAGGSITFQYECCGVASPNPITACVAQPLAITPIPILVQYTSSLSVIHKSDFSGISLTISTAGNLAQFSITSRDAFSNRRLVGGESMYLYVSKSDGTIATASISDSGNGIYLGSYVPAASGAYVVSVALGSSARTFSMTVFPNVVCASKCIATSNQLTLSTAGFIGSFTVTMRDSSSNFRTSFNDDLVVKMSGPWNERKNLPVTYASNSFSFPYIPTYQASYRTSRSGTFSIDVQVAVSNGLNASFFIDPNLSQLVMSRIDSTLNFDWGTGSPDSSVSAVDLFSIQWSGFVKPDYGGEYTFSTTIADIGDRLRLWVDDQYIINFWNSAPSLTSNSATIKLSSNTLYDIKLQYRDTSGSASVSLTWIRYGLAASSIPSNRLISSTASVAGSPFTATVFPALTCGSTSTASGSGLSLATAGVPASFTITAHDHVGNRITHSLDTFSVRARSPSSSVADRVGTITAVANGVYSGVFTPILKRNEVSQWHDVIISMAVPSGALMATYYSNANGLPLLSATSDLSGSSTPGGISVTYNARYSGFIQPSTSSWTFSVGTASGTLSVKIDGVNVLSGVGSTVIVGSAANSLFDIDISLVGQASGSPSIALILAGVPQTLNLMSSRVFQRHDLTFKVFDSFGLAATFYSGSSFSTPLNTATVANIDWSYATNSPKYHSSAPSSGAYGVRWLGFFRPTMRDVYTFYFQKSSGETSVTLSLDNGASVSISDGSTEGSATIFIPFANHYYEISVQLLSTNSGTAVFRLMWLNDGNTYANYDRPASNPAISVKTVIAIDSFFRIRTSTRINREDQSRYFDAAGLPDCGSTSSGNLLRWYQCRGHGLRYNDAPNVEVRPASSCGSKSSITTSNLYLSLSTAGVPGSFDIVTKDQYDNILDGWNAAVSVIGIQQSGISAGKFYGSVLPTSAGKTAADPSGLYTITYMATVAGTYLLNVGLADSVGNGLRGVYFSGTSLGGRALANQIDSMLNFSWGTSPPVPLLSSFVGWSARWTGFVRLSDSSSNEFTFFLRAGAGGGRVYIANTLVVDSTTAWSAGEYFGTTSLQNNVIYDIVVEYVASDVPTYVQLSYASPSNPKQVFPSSSLYPFSANLLNGARTLTITPSTICGALSLKSGRGLTIATAGIMSTFKLTSRDQYGNFRSDQSNIADCSSDVPSCSLSATIIPAKPSISPSIRASQASVVLQNVNNFFNVQYTVTAAGGYSVAASASPSNGGLFATYYDDLLFAIPKASQLAADPGWTLLSTNVPSVSGASLIPDGLFSVKFSGLFKPTVTGSHTFAITHTEALSMYVDNILLIDQSTYSGVSVARSGVITLPVANAFYDVTILYSSDALSGSQLTALSVNGVAFSSLTNNLFASLPIGASSTLVVYPNVPCGSRSTIRGYGLTVATAGASVLLTVTVRDEYYNFRTQTVDNVVVRAFALTGSSVTPAPNFFNGFAFVSGCSGCPTAPVMATLTDASNSLYTVSLLLTIAGNYKIAASLARKGGLSATFYAQDNTFSYNTAVSGTAAFATLDFSSASAASARWHGFIQPSQAGSYTFTVVPVSSSNEFIKLWINQQLIIDRSGASLPTNGFSATYNFASANSLYDIFVAYSTGGGGFNMFWERMGSSAASFDVPRQSIPSTRLFNRDDVSGDGWYSVAAASVFHSVGCGSTSIVTGLAVTLTAGTLSAFTISSRDAYSNARTIGSDFTFNSVSIHSSGAPTVYGSVTYSAAGSSAYNSDRTLTVSGTYYLHIRGGGAHVQGSPFTITLLPAQECSSKSLAFGAGLTVTTVNIASSFYVQVRDAWGNIRTLPNVQTSSIYVARAFTSSIGSNPESTDAAPYAAAVSTNAMQAYWQLPSWYVGSYQFTAAPAQGNYAYFKGVSMGALGGFSVTYYHNLASVDASISSGTPLKTAVDRFANSNTLPSTTNVFAARWSGFIRSTTSGTVTWNAFSQTGSVKGKIWVNGGATAFGSPVGNSDVSVVFTTVTNTLYQVQIEYKGTVAAAPIDSFGSSVATVNMYTDFSISGVPTSLAVY